MKYFFGFVFIFISHLIYSQEMIIDWDECFGSNHSGGSAKAISTLSNNNIVTSIQVISNNNAYTNYHGESDIWVLILDEDGDLVNERCFGGSEDEWLKDIEVTNNYIYFFGQTQSSDGDVQSEPVGGYVDLWVVKTDYDLNIIWERRYGSLGVQEGHRAKITPEGGLIISMDFFIEGGGDVSQYYGNTDLWVCEIDANGDIIWEKTLGNEFGNYPGDILVTDHNTTIVMGGINASGDMVDCYCHSTDGITRDIWILELDEEGEILWQNCYGGTDWDSPSKIIQDENGYTISGKTRSNNGDVSGNHLTGVNDAWFFHIDNTGALIWQKCFGGNDLDTGGTFFKTNNNGYLLFCSTDSNDGDVNNTHCPSSQAYCPHNTWVIELDADRNIIWNKTYGTAQNSSAYADVQRIGEKDFILAGMINEDNSTSGDAHCSPYPVESGKSAWIYRLYDPTQWLSNLANSSLKTYPNPAINQVFIDLPEHNDIAEIEIINIFGNTIKQLIAISGQTQIKWSCQDAATGVYFYQTEIGGVVYRGKIVINK